MSAAVAAAAAAAAIGNRCYSSNNNNSTTTTTSNFYGTSQNLNLNNNNNMFLTPPSAAATPSRYESQKRRDWNTFGQYLKNHKPPLTLSRCSGAHVLEFLRYLDQFGKTKVHVDTCQFFGHANHPVPCPCPLKQAWGSLDAVIGRLRAAFEEHGGLPETNPFGARAVRLYLREVRDSQARARGIVYEKKRKNKSPVRQPQYNYGTASSASLIGRLQYYTDVNSSYASPYNNGGRSYGNYLQHGHAL